MTPKTTYQLLGGAEADIDRILLQSAQSFGIDAAERYNLLIRTAFALVGDMPGRIGSRDVAAIAGVRVFPPRLARHLAPPDQRAGRPRYLVVY